MIDKSIFEYLIKAFDMGTSTAEKDPLLPTAQIQTQEFSDMLFDDRIDLIRGIKGAGKTALYRVFNLLSNNNVYLEENYNLFCIFGVEATGDPVFKQFKDDFSKFDSSDFENFWMVYFLSLIRDELTRNKSLNVIINCSEDARCMDQFWKDLEVPFETSTSLYQKVKNIIASIHLSASTEFSSKPTGDMSVTPKIDLSSKPENAKQVFKQPKYVGDFRNKICALLKNQGYRIWILLDRLDEVFERRTKVEENGLKGLLKAAYNLSDPFLRIKIFLRDDIIEQLANSEQGFTALTHVTDRASATMRWSREKILHLIVKRLSAMEPIKLHFNIDDTKLDQTIYCEQCLSQVFPRSIGNYPTIDWIISSLSDGNGIVTPRDVIDLFNLAKAIEYRQFITNKEDKEHLISKKSFKEALDTLSSEKRNKYLMAEFPHMKENILKLEGHYSIHNQKSLEDFFGESWNKILADFISIGILKHDSKKGYYRIPKIWMKGLRITQGKNF